MSRIIRILSILTTYILLPMGCSAASGASVASPSTTPTIPRGASRATIAQILGSSTRDRDMGKPVDLTTKKLREIERVYTEPGEIPQLRVDIDGEKLDLPLDHTHVKANITGNIARVEVTQTYENPFEYPIEAIYVFPLPENSAVDNMKIVIGERVIEAEIQMREDARRTYNIARDAGHTAALLEQERPNVFTQSVANIEPGKSIDVVVQYLQNLTYDAGEYEFVFPMVVGPRFFAGNPIGTTGGSGYAQDTDKVPDASRISPPVLGGGMRSGHDISLELVANAGVPIKSFNVPTHDVANAHHDNATLALELAEYDSIPNRDFILKYAIGSAQTQASVITERDPRGGFLTLILQPPELDIDGLVGQREIIFVVDVSGSMSGVPLSMCQDAMEHALKALRPVDTFNVITFAGRTGQLFTKPSPANDTQIQAAMAFVRGLKAGGSTQMHLGVQAALRPGEEPMRNRYVFFMTDGYIGGEREIFQGTRTLIQTLERRGQTARVFGFGVGSSVNRHLLDGIGKAGRGVTVYSSTREDPSRSVNTFFRYIDHPILKNVSVDWGTLDIEQVFPSTTPDLFASRPLVMHARFNGEGRDTVTIRGDLNGRKVELPVKIELPKKSGAAKNNGSLGTLWARAKIDTLERDLWGGNSTQAVEGITKLGLDFRLVTPYTSFVAVDKSRSTNGDLRTIVQPVEIPEGVNAQAAGAHVYSYNRLRRAAAPKARSLGRVGSYGVGSGGGGYVEMKGSMVRGLFDSQQGSHDFDGAVGKTAPTAARAPIVNQEKPKERTLPDVQVKGSLSARSIRQTIRRYEATIRRCYAGTLAASGFRGEITLQWFVTPDGKVIQMKISRGASESDSALEAFESCLAQEMKRWVFPAPPSRDTVRVKYRFRF